MSRVRRLLLLLTLPAIVTPAPAVRRLAVGRDGDTIAATPTGDVVVFDAPGRPKVRRRFGPGLLSLDASTRRPVVTVLRRPVGAPAVIERWDYDADTCQAAPAELAAAAHDLAITHVGEALLVTAKDGVAVVDLATLAARRVIPAPGLGEGELDLAISAWDSYVAVAAPTAVWLGRSDQGELQRTGLGLSDGPAPVVRFTPDLKRLIGAGDCGVVLQPIKGLPQRLDVTVPLSGVVDLASDGRTLYLAETNRVHTVRLRDALTLNSGLARPEPAAPSDLAVNGKWGVAAVLYRDGQLCWYQPQRRELLAAWPPLAAPSLPPVTAPGSAADRLAAVQSLLTGGTVFAQEGDPLDVFVLDRELNRLHPLEDLARQEGWASLVLALLGTAAAQPELVPEAWRAQQAALATVDLVQLRNVRPKEGSGPRQLEALLGAAVATGQNRMSADGRLYPLYRFGPFLLPLDGDRFPAGTALELSATPLQAYLRGS